MRMTESPADVDVMEGFCGKGVALGGVFFATRGPCLMRNVVIRNERPEEVRGDEWLPTPFTVESPVGVGERSRRIGSLAPTSSSVPDRGNMLRRSRCSGKGAVFFSESFDPCRLS